MAIPFLVALCLLLATDAWMPILAQAASGEEAPPADPEAQRAARKAEKERAKQARIEEYLRKREERRARRAMEKQAADEARAESAEAIPAAVGPAAPVVGAVAAEPEKPEKGKKKKQQTTAEEFRLPRNLERIHEDLRKSPLGEDPSVVSYMDLIESGNASAHQLAAFGSFLAQTGRVRDGIEYYAVALDMEPGEAVLWMNVGTLHRQLGEYSIAAETYSEALAIDGNNAFAHYNLGAIFDLQGKYEEAIEEYKLALTLDPSLGDPVTNPQAANNERLLAVKLMLYKQQAGSLGLPLVDVPGGSVESAEDDR